MGDIKILTFATLGVALAALIKSAEGKLKDDLVLFNTDFGLLAKKVDADTTLTFEQSNVVINELKEQLQAAIESKEATATNLTVTINKVAYIVNHGSYPHSKEAISADPELAKSILKINGQNVLTKL